MGKCINHPEIDTSYQCHKYGHFLCEKCIECKDPKLYCKFRSACLIWFMETEAQALRKVADQ